MGLGYHCSVLAEDAIKAAIDDYRSKYGQDDEEEQKGQQQQPQEEQEEE